MRSFKRHGRVGMTPFQADLVTVVLAILLIVGVASSHLGESESKTCFTHQSLAEAGLRATSNTPLCDVE